MIKITKEDATALRYSNGELPKEVLVGEYEVTTITPTGQVRKADIYGKDFSSDYYDLIIDESVKTLGRKHTYVRVAIILVLLFSALFCHSQTNVSKMYFPSAAKEVVVIDTTVKYDTVLAVICKRANASIAHTRIVILRKTRFRIELFSDLKGKKMDDYFFIQAMNLTEQQLKKARNAN